MSHPLFQFSVSNSLKMQARAAPQFLQASGITVAYWSINFYFLLIYKKSKKKKKKHYNTFTLLILSEMAYLAIFWLVRFEENRKRFDQVWILFYIYKQPTYKIGLFLMKRRIKLKNWKKTLNPIGTVHYWKKIILHIASSVHDIQILPEDNNWTTTLH